MTAGNVSIKVLEDPYHAGRGRMLPVGRDRDELQLDSLTLPPQGSREVRHEHDRALEDADEQNVGYVRVVRRDLACQLLDLVSDLLLGHDDALDVRTEPDAARVVHPRSR